MNDLPWISLLTGLPALGAVLLALWRPAGADRARAVALGFAAVILAAVLGLAFRMDPTTGFHGVERHPWIPSIGAEYHVGVDGLGLVPVVLTALLVPFAMLLSTGVRERPAAYFAWLLLLESALLGAFTALNFIHWFLFWELSLVPAFFLIQGWGGAGCRGAALQFFVYTFVGSIAMLLGMLGVFLAAGTLDLVALGGMARSGTLATAIGERFAGLGVDPATLRGVLAGGVFLGLAVKLPIVPLHTWLPTAYGAAPTPVTVLLTGVLSKLGVYGMLRILLPLFPGEIRDLSPVLTGLAVVTIVAPALAALRETGLKRILAYSSVNHLGYCLLGVVAAARAGQGDGHAAASSLSGVILQMFNHGIIAALLFGLVARWEVRMGTDDLRAGGGLRAVAPVYSGLMGLAVFASLGLPGLSGFVGEFLVFRGAFAVAPWATALSLVGLLATAFFLVGLYQRAFAGAPGSGTAGFHDLSGREVAWMVPGAVLVVVLGFAPQLLLDWTNPWVRDMARVLGMT